MRLRVPVSAVPWKRLFRELGVIVAGVLIALTVDSWWERQQEQRQAEAYLQQLLEDFRTTQRRIQGAIAGDSERVERVNSVLRHAAGGSVSSADSLDHLTGFNQFLPLTGTLTALVESGDLRLIGNDSIRFELIRLSALIKATETILHDSETLIWHSTEQLIRGGARHSLSTGRGPTGIDVAGALKDPDIISALQLQSTASQVRLFNLGRLEKPITDIIRRLNEEVGSSEPR